MKVTFHWLKKYVDFPWSPQELSERLTMLGLEVEGVQSLGGEFEGVVVAQVLTRDKHPNADKLTVCRVNDGQGERQIVCGATNFKAGDKVPLILPGASLPAEPGAKPFTIKVGKIRGVESQGMMCSPKELGLSDDAAGLLILSADARVGDSFAKHLGRAEQDTVYDLEITPNRPDLNSVIGIAREIAALTGHPLQLPDPGIGPGAVQIAATSPDSAIYRYVAVRLDAPDLCPRYAARVITGVKIGPSPDWLRITLEKVGVRSISNVVDVTNYVMLETGQPLHAFDYRLLSQDTQGVPTIVVRRAGQGERFKTLDGHEHELTSDNLLIADEAKGIALAGVMGGLNTEINDQTVDVLIESAYFKPQNIRATSKRHGLRTESSYRFERGCDPNIADWASRRAAQLILETAGGSLVPGVVDAYPNPVEPRTITLRHRKTDQLLGLPIAANDQTGFLTRLGLELIGTQGQDACTVRIPTFRVDLKEEVDLVEEVARMYGVDRLPATPPRNAIGVHACDSIHDQLADVRRLLTGLGFSEAQGQTLIAQSAAQWTGSTEAAVALANPLSADMTTLRPSLLPGLIEALRRNLSHQQDALALFEIGHVFNQTPEGAKEERRLALLLSGRRSAPFWSGSDREALFDLHDLKGALEEFFDRLGLRGWTLVPVESSATLYLESAQIQLGRLGLGQFGQLDITLARRLDLRAPVFLAELSLETILARRNTVRSFKSLALYPAIRRDVAMFVPESISHEAVLRAIRQSKPQHLEAVELFDVFRGSNVPEGRKSMAYSLIYRSVERTLTDAEVNATQTQVIENLKRDLQAVVRDAG